MKSIFTFALVFITFPLLFAQNQDCITALELETKETVTIVEVLGIGEEDEALVTNECLGTGSFEDQSMWFTFTAIEAGNFYFTVQPNNPTTDLDFFLMKAENNDCSELVSVRCNASSCKGENGNTGMAPDDSDLFENVNCDQGENAYVSDLDIEIGDKYYLLINNFSVTGEGYTLTICGTAILGDNDTICTDGILHNNLEAIIKIKISPNPSSGQFEIENYEFVESMEVLNLSGGIVHSQKIIQPEINIDLVPAYYFLKMQLKSGEIAIQKIIIIE